MPPFLTFIIMMTMDESLKLAQEAKIRAVYGDAAALVRFMAETLDSFGHRYLATALEPAPAVEHGERSLAIQAREASMVQALKVSRADIQAGIKELARRVPRAQSPTVLSSLRVEWEELRADHGALVVIAAVDWGFPDHASDGSERVAVRTPFRWEEFGDFRKKFPLALEKASELFL